ncbi:MAG: ribonuclease R [Candidatus Paceibacterota bacterium]
MARKTNKKRKKQSFEGPLAVTSQGIGYLTVEKFEDDIQIQENLMKTALHGDLVKVSLLPQKKGERIQGEVTEILERARYEFVGTIKRTEDSCFLVPDDRRVYRDFHIPNPPDNAYNGHKAMVKLTEWSNPKDKPQAEVVTVIGPAGEHEVEMNAIVKERGFDVKFPEKVEREAKKLQDERSEMVPEKEGRRDMRDRKTFTIDPQDAKDFDDALSIKELNNGDREIGVHIADVSFYVKEGNDLDKEARKRGTSVYLVDRTIPMLPEELSNDLCSLNPNEDKRAFSAVFIVDKQGTIKDRWFGRTAITSDRRFNYKEAQEVLDTGKGDMAEELQSLNTFAKKLRKKKFKKGAIDFETSEVGFELDEDGTPKRIFIKKRMASNQLIEDLMLLANKEVAYFLYDEQDEEGSKKRGAIYRVHERPDPEKLSDLLTFLRALGHNISIDPEDMSPKELNRILRKVTGESEETLVKTAAIRSMSKAVYSTKNIGHFGLAFKHYTHFTSPIRRYPDLVVHRLISKRLKGKKMSSKEIAMLETVAKESTQAEIKATEAERESIKLKQVEYMEKHKGEVFEAVISGVTGWGLYVEEKNTLSSGMVHITKLGDDFYEFDEKNFALIGKETGKKFALGDEIKVKLIDADPDERRLSFELV